jgi:hypothetical protein
MTKKRSTVNYLLSAIGLLLLATASASAEATADRSDKRYHAKVA